MIPLEETPRDLHENENECGKKSGKLLFLLLRESATSIMIICILRDSLCLGTG